MKNPNEIVSVSVTVAERIYPIKVKAADEHLLREAEQLINHKFNEFQLRFSGQEKQDYLAMSALMNLVDLMKKENDADASLQLLNNKMIEAEELLSSGLRK